MRLNDAALTFDRVHLTASGNDRLAGSLLQPVLDIARGRDSMRAARGTR